MVARGVTELRGRTEQVAGQQEAASPNPLHSQSALDIQRQKSPIFTKARRSGGCLFFFLTIQVYEIAAQSR